LSVWRTGLAGQRISRTNARNFYDRLLAVLRQPVVRDGQWQLLECASAWEENWTSDCFLASAWQGPDDKRLLLAVNYAPNQSQCWILTAVKSPTERSHTFCGGLKECVG
jgi:hypothetical protein